MRPLGRVLVANRGEIALRIIRACHEEGLEAVAVYSDVDRSAQHVTAADHAVRLGPAPPAQSYLAIDKLVAAAQSSGAGLVHPGYGFLAERPEFAEAVTAAGLTFVGPPAEAIRAMGNKTEARRRMAAAGVPIVPGAQQDTSDPAAAAALAEEIGYPVMVKAAAGGGGKGMRVVAKADDLAAALDTASSEALKAFGDGSVYLEKFIANPRHVEIQILADGERAVHLGERECSVQRRHQKLVEEAPSVAVDPELRGEMGRAAVAGALAVGYRGAGTFEFLLSPEGSFYFLEMNTRIQVEHPVTELVHGVDLVREQLRIALGGLLELPDDAGMSPNGWAIECRITSEDPASGFLPTTGRVRHLSLPSGPGVRWDGGVAMGDEITLHYDSLLGKLIVWGPTRGDALARMRRALDELVLIGPVTNQGFHRRLMSDPGFCSGDIDIQFLERRSDLLALEDGTGLELVAIAAALAEEESRRVRQPAVGSEDNRDPSASRWAAVARRESLR